MLKACNSSIIFLIVARTLRRGDKLRRRRIQLTNNIVVVPVKFALPPNGVNGAKDTVKRPTRWMKRLEKVSNNQRGFRFLIEPHLLLQQPQLLGIWKSMLSPWFQRMSEKGNCAPNGISLHTLATKLRNLKRVAANDCPIVLRKQTRNSICAAVQVGSRVRGVQVLFGI